MQRRSVLSISVQLAGIAVGIAALAWCIHLAMQPQHRDAFLRLRDISLAHALTLLSLTVVSLVLNGLCFWATIRAHRQLGVVDVLATNCIGTLLAFLPFKLSVVFRVLVHNRRDAVPLFTIGAWFAAVALGALLIVGPLTAATLWREKIDAQWFLVVGLATPAAAALAMTLARLLSGPAGLQHLQRFAASMPTDIPRRISHSAIFAQIHSGCAMVCSAWFALSLIIRALDLLVQAARFYLVSRVLGVELSFGNAVLFSGCYFLIGVVSPSGSAGAREGGVTALAKLRSVLSWESLAPIALTVTACELVVLMVLSPFAALVLKPWRLKPPATPASTPPT